ncbi:hypothetical protein SYNPS1DRAFT_20739 [Syncephalis pseudoplumigaleata]|uniref:Plus3 domain-containing protein n=1 Tax=Syncephalis pseudoplumigaleata TaxID=1712513 RepID=A0A4P9Z5P1_9FUNG|nr:hypothetical protein SYNPS1DRAFT_20739 [Syncephalis pseudoplumigaleata]|eukprot:RKP27845.1 hypothetical protein SYNPS1DRAFT_20739 [Syncephalis pseudoplumigaleata]
MDDLSDEILALMNGDMGGAAHTGHHGTSSGGSGGRGKRGSSRTDSRKSRKATSLSNDDNDDDDEESDSDLDPSRVDDYGPDLMGDEEDRRRLASMTEFEREQVLHERAERRQQLIERLEIKRKLRTSERRHGAGGSGDKRRSARVVPANDEQARGLSELRRRREEKQARGWGDKGYDEGGDDDYERQHRSYSDDEDGDYYGGRSGSKKWAHTPFFEQAVTGAFIRVSIGPGPDGNMVYQVESQAKSYMVGATTTNLVLQCSHGKAAKLFKMDTVSNGPCTQREFDRYMGTLKHEELKLISWADIDRKQKDLAFARNYVLNDREVEEMVRVKQSLIMFNPTLEKAKLIAEIDRVLEGQTNERQRAMQQLNERNRRLNLMEIRKVEEEMRRQRRKATTTVADGTGTGLSSFEQMIAGVSKTTLDVDLDELLA